MKHLVLFVIFLFIVSPYTAEADDSPSLLLEGGIQSILALQDNFNISFNDQVTDGCLPSPSRMKDKMEIALRQNGFKISYDDNPFKPKIYITAMGYKIANGGCVVYLEAELIIWDLVTVPFASEVREDDETIAPISYEFGSVLLTGSKSNMQSRIEKSIKDFGDELFLDISRSKDMMGKKFPVIYKEYKERKIK